MSSNETILVLPRPGNEGTTDSSPTKKSIPGPSETSFTNTFGALLPPARTLRTVNGKAAYYELFPSSGSTPNSNVGAAHRVLVIHGVQTPAIGMLPLARALHTSYPNAHIILVDLWGHGLSDTPILPHNARLFHHLIDALLDQLDWPSAHMIGYSFGGVVTAGYASWKTEHMQSMTLVAPAGLISSSQFSPEQRVFLRGGGDEVAAQKWIHQFLEGGNLVVPDNWKERVGRGEVVAEAVREWQLREHPGHAASVVGIFRDGGVLDNEATFLEASGKEIPTLVVLGEMDDVCREEDVRKLGFTNVSVIPQVGHGVVRQRVPELTSYIEIFWATLQ